MNLCSRGNTVLVKPNIASPDGFSSTNPAVTWPVLVIDVDGTLLDTKADLTPFTREVLNRYLDTGGPGIPDLSTFQL